MFENGVPPSTPPKEGTQLIIDHTTMKENHSGKPAYENTPSSSDYPSGYFTGRTDKELLSTLAKEFGASIHTLRSWRENVLESFEGGNGEPKKASRLEVATRLVQRGLKSNLTPERLQELHEQDRYPGVHLESAISTTHGESNTQLAQADTDEGVNTQPTQVSSAPVDTHAQGDANQIADTPSASENMSAVHATAKGEAVESQIGNSLPIQESAAREKEAKTTATKSDVSSEVDPCQKAKTSAGPAKENPEKAKTKRPSNHRGKAVRRFPSGKPNRHVRRSVEVIQEKWSALPLEQRIRLLRDFKSQVKAETKF